VSNKFLKALPELMNADIITPEKASEIKRFYELKSKKSSNKLIVVFGILGAMLVGLGIILIIAHNWDNLSRTTKSFFAFLPLVIGQLISGFVILKKRDSITWREGASVFLILSVGASISLISQIYNIPGNLSSFLLTWISLSVPMIYLMNSSVSAMLVIIGITYYACETSYWSGPNKSSFEYWLILTTTLPHYYQLFKIKPNSNFLILINWLIPLSILICLGTLARNSDDLMFIPYFSLLSLFYIIGNLPYFNNQLVRNNAYLVIGSMGTIVMLLMLSFDWFWTDLLKNEIEIWSSQEFYIAIILTFSATIVLGWKIKKHGTKYVQLMHFTFILFIIIFSIGFYNSLIPVILINLLIFVIGISIIKKGADRDHLGILNYGLSIVTALVICRFFDTNIPFVIRGLLFIIIGTGFFIANYLMIKRRKTYEN
jgi:uncharacterized membrane protein